MQDSCWACADERRAFGLAGDRAGGAPLAAGGVLAERADWRWGVAVLIGRVRLTVESVQTGAGRWQSSGGP